MKFAHLVSGIAGRAAMRAALALATVALLTSAASASGPRALADGKLPDDRRLGELKDLNAYFPFTPPESADEWSDRAERLRRQVLVATGLWPMPEKTPSQAVVHGKVDRGDYTVEKVYLQSYPGHFVTGNLYRPKGKSGRLPAVLCPHGHWPAGRFHDHGARIDEEIKTGAEKFKAGGRHPLQARCVQLARMGCVVFLYDMVGYADSVQLAHRPGARPEMNTPENWGYFSPQAESRLQTMMGLQTYNSVRALDWLSSLPDVDPQRIAVTGASGGGTQTFILCAIDPRPAVSFPAVMVSTAMQGGCTCENANYLRVGSGNIELAALFAPKPLAMTGANDWTREIETKGLPELRRLYALLRRPNHVAAKYYDFPHNYNAVSRAMMYRWLNEHLKLGLGDAALEERDYQPLSVEEATVWNDEHGKPPSGDEYERSLLRTITEASDRQIAALEPRGAASLAEYRRIVGGAVEAIIGRGLPPAEALEFEKKAENDRDTYLELVGLLRQPAQGEELPVVFLRPKSWNGQVVIWVDPAGKAGLYASDGSPCEPVKKLLEGGASVAGIDLVYQGEFLPPGQQKLEKQRLLSSGRDAWATYAGYTFGYNPPLFAQRVHDILTLVSFVRAHESQPREVHLAALRGGAGWAAAAAAQARGAVDRVAVDTQGFRFAKLTAIDDPDFVPGMVKYGDLPALLALAAPGKLWVAGEGAEVPQPVQSAYGAAGKPERLVAYEGKESQQAAIGWLLGR